MRYAIKISSPWRPLFSVFGFKANQSYLELKPDALEVHFGTAHESIPLSDISGVAPADWPFYYGLGAKYGPKGGVGFVGSLDGVLEVGFNKPQSMNVWGPFKRADAKCLTVSLEDPNGFTAALEQALRSTKN